MLAGFALGVAIGIYIFAARAYLRDEANGRDNR